MWARIFGTRMFGTRCAAARYFRRKTRLRELEAVKLQKSGEQLLHEELASARFAELDDTACICPPPSRGCQVMVVHFFTDLNGCRMPSSTSLQIFQLGPSWVGW